MVIILDGLIDLKIEMGIDSFLSHLYKIMLDYWVKFLLSRNKGVKEQQSRRLEREIRRQELESSIDR